MKNQLYAFCNIAAAVLILSTLGCNGLLEIAPPKNQITNERVFEDSTSAVSAISNPYFIMANRNSRNLNVFTGVFSDEYIYTRTQSLTIEYQENQVTPDNSWNQNTWSYLYQVIYSCNDLIEQCTDNQSLTESLIQQLTGEAKFLRGLAYFYLINLYGDVPLLLQTDVVHNRQASRSGVNEIYAQIIGDLIDAKSGLKASYPSTERVRANTYTASALLARVYLYLGEWEKAETEASELINSGQYALQEDPDDAFLAGSKEAILQLWTENGYVSDATSLIPSSSTMVPEYVVTPELVALFSENDARNAWVGYNTVTSDGTTAEYPFPFKYKIRSSNSSTPEYLMILRLAEQYLIRAEARVMKGNIKGAVDDVNQLRIRANLTLLPEDITSDSLLDAIMNERRIELFGEWGHRFFDLKRTGKLDEVLGETKEHWDTTDSRFPIPENELLANSNLVQNPGY